MLFSLDVLVVFAFSIRVICIYLLQRISVCQVVEFFRLLMLLLASSIQINILVKYISYRLHTYFPTGNLNMRVHQLFRSGSSS